MSVSPAAIASAHAEHRSPAKAQAALQNLAQLRKGDRAIVTGLAPSANAETQALILRLLELGFTPGEPLRVVAVSFPQGDPMAIRVGNSTFALRRHEAALVYVEPAA